ncbi:gamma-glutamyltransferase family protein [Microlunatus parietis]|uniref:Gamma-glutamyltranspeptidase/glutathione hydrolase n=1 Tax=Microlunatus parietis TaxID=682979 RepID=A0A7Y9IAE7_9ACTN|nr:gamma-glutamyltransferase [Microlunatus parietis]NYE72951.1 gamma-glutamyltranspeptidase/glutathione hydrolase [Microlunatus parietis]
MTGELTGRIVSPDARATRAGEQVLADGGSAADAVIATAAVLCVVSPHMVTIGGDSWTLAGPADGAVQAINGTGRAPQGLTPEHLRGLGQTTMPGSGVHSISVPGLPSAWHELHLRYGTRPLAELLAPAIELARDGAEVAPSLARDLAQYADRLAEDPGARALFLNADGSALTLGDRYRQPALARSLEALAEKGIADMYGGELGAAYAAGLAALGGTMTRDDLARHRADVVAPLTLRWRDAEVITAPPSSQGFALLKMLALAEALGLTDPLDPAQAAAFVRAFELAGAQRDARSADPEAVEVDLAAVLDPDAVRRDAAALGSADRRAAPDRIRLDGDTIGIAAVDGAGLWISSLQSVAGTFGSLVVEPTTGILGHNRASGFSLDPARPGVLAGGRRPPHTLMPCLVRREGRLDTTVATMGGRSQPAIVAQLLARLAGGATADQALRAPRIVVTPGTGPRSVPEVLVEAAAPAAVRAVLETEFTAQVIEGPDNRFGHAHLVRAVPAGLDAGTDPRADGS